MLQIKRFLPLALAALLFIPYYTMPANATDDCNTVMTTHVDQFYQGPVYVDAYWTEASQSLNTSSSDTITEREVGPGEGKATLAVVLNNRSLKDISGIVGYLQLPDGYEPAGTSVYSESKTIMGGNGKSLGFNQPAVASYQGIVTTKSSFTLYFDVNITDKATVGSIPTHLVLQYYITDQLGLCTSAQLTFPMVLSGKTILDITTDDNYLTPKEPNTVNITIENKGTADATGLVAAIVGLGDSGTRSQNNADGSVVLQSSDTELINMGDKVFNIGTIPAHGAVTVNTVIYPGKESAGTVQNMNIELTYGNAHGDTQNVIIGTGLVISPNPVDSSINISYENSEDSHILTAEKLQDLNFIVKNTSPSTLTDVVVSLVPQSTSMTIVGDSKWTIPSLEPDETKEISAKVIAAKSMVATPTSFTANLSYVADGEERTDALTLGAFVTGDVNLKVYDVSISYVGDVPNLIGSVLNQGNTNALYTNVELVSPKSHNKTAVVPPQYMGDISADSSIPFSIPVPGLLKEGQNPVTFKVTYSDDLKNVHELTVDSSVSFEPKQDTTRQGFRQGGGGGIFEIMRFVIPVIAAAGGAGGTAIFMKRKYSKPSKASLANFESDLDTLLDEHSKKSSDPK